MAIKHGIKAKKGAHARMVSQSRPSVKTIPVRPIPEPVQQHLQSTANTLRDIESIVIVSAGALREAGECIGAIVAHILRTQVGNRLSLEIDRIAGVLG